MSKTVLCGPTFVVSLVKLWPKGLSSLKAKSQEKERKTQEKSITCFIYAVISHLYLKLEGFSVQISVHLSHLERKNVDFLHFYVTAKALRFRECITPVTGHFQGHRRTLPFLYLTLNLRVVTV